MTPTDLTAEPTCALARVEPVELAWAAGFFDGEGSTIAYECRPGYLRLVITVAQFGRSEVPEVLIRFQKAMLCLGEIVPQGCDGMWHWRARSPEEGQAAIALLWSHLGTVKRAQAASAMRRFRMQYGPAGLRPRPPRRTRETHLVHAGGWGAVHPPEMLERAWVAGFLDGEGWFGRVRSAGARKNGPDWYRIRVSATQRSESDGPPAVLLRLQRVMGLGRIERHGDPDAYKWVVEGADRVECVLDATRDFLGRVKLDQAASALQAFRAQPWLKGTATHCVRGHPYTRHSMRGGRLRKICSACDRIRDRQERASRGIPPRQFKNAARRYNF